ncbi:MAG: hypothetical protein E6I30_01975 [Chloroflexi bacterium]|nr:MAG: hypothetical protein E6I30_01975 [Chloroflexota bacterium]
MIVEPQPNGLSDKAAIEPPSSVLGGSIPIHPRHHSLNWQPKRFVSRGALRSACPTPHRAYDRRSNPPRKEKDMAGPVVHKLSEKPRPRFGTARREDVPAFIGIMQILHQEPISSAFSRLVSGMQQPDDEIPMAHVFEEISTLALHGLLPEDLLFDAFAIDIYWSQLEARVQQVRKATSNDKFCENFEIAAELAVAYREERPAKVIRT